MTVKIRIIFGAFLGFAAFSLFYFAYTPDLPLAYLKEKYTNEESAFFSLDGLDIHYRIHGNQNTRTVLLLHGTSSSLHTWDGWVSKLAHNYQVIRLDLPGFGLTGPDPEHDYSIDKYLHYLRVFMEQLEVDSFAIAGNSFGGRIAWEYARTYPEQITGMILIDASGFKSPFDPSPSLGFKLARTPVLRSFVRNFTPWSLYRNSILEVYGDDDKVTDQLIDRYYELSLRAGNRDAFIKKTNEEYAFNTLLPGQIRCPVLIMWGDADVWIPPDHALMFREAIPQAEVILYENVGHVPMEEIPSVTVEDAIQFLDQSFQ